ncbi:hypothetical protein TNCV_4438321 [Trichonephila clavipes]|nr:hypothetical protein TNCV_4438321 [Trichonephila clavipes]
MANAFWVSMKNDISKRWNTTENVVSKNQSLADSAIRLPNTSHFRPSDKSRFLLGEVVTNLYGTFPLILLGVFGECKFVYISNQLWKKKMGYSNKLRTSLSRGRLILPERLGSGLSGTGGLLVSESVSLAEDCDRSGTATSVYGTPCTEDEPNSLFRSLEISSTVSAC